MTNLVGVLKQLQVQRNAIEEQLSRINKAVEALRGMGKNGVGRAATRSTRVMSAAARKRIAAAQKARWAKWRAANKKAS
jgi:hypothetical protein